MEGVKGGFFVYVGGVRGGLFGGVLVGETYGNELDVVGDGVGELVVLLVGAVLLV